MITTSDVTARPTQNSSRSKWNLELHSTGGRPKLFTRCPSNKPGSPVTQTRSPSGAAPQRTKSRISAGGFRSAIGIGNRSLSWVMTIRSLTDVNAPPQWSRSSASNFCANAGCANPSSFVRTARKTPSVGVGVTSSIAAGFASGPLAPAASRGAVAQAESVSPVIETAAAPLLHITNLLRRLDDVLRVRQ